MQASTTATNDPSAEMIPTIKAMEEAVSQIFQGSFDEDSKACLVTLMKVLDNVLHKPADDRVRTLRLGNPTFRKKVASRPGGVEFLLACGFTRVAPMSIGEPQQGEETLVLLPPNEKQSRLLTARRLLRRRAIEDLHMKEEELPILREPPTIVTTGTNNNNSNLNNGGGATFNPYVGHRHDAKSAAVGANLGPGSNYVSPTDRQLEALQRQKNKLEQQAEKKFTDREWKAWAPGEMVRLTESTTTTAAPAKSDAALLAQRAKAQQVARQQREEGGFTTAAMRQVAALKNKKVYSHVQITIQFADQSKLTGKFLPKEKIGTVLESLRQECLIDSVRELDLYVAPPRRLLPLNSSLEQEGLVPAAKIFASWKVQSAPAAGEAVLRPHLFQNGTAAAASFPSAQPIVKAPVTAATPAAAAAPPPKKKKESREEMMLKRMMGKK